MAWHDKGKLLSFRAFFNLLVGNRGSGKTYGFKTWSVDDFLKNKKQFIWLRRYGTEIELMKKSFFDDIASKYPKHSFSCKGSKKSGTFYVDGEACGYYFALSTSSIAKSSSFPNVDKIIFDEFLIMGNTYKYLSDEVVLLLEFVETIFRNRENDPTAIKPRGVYLLGNNITIANPYFLYFHIPNFKGRFWQDRGRGIAVEKYSDPEFVQTKKASKIGLLTADTQYADYAIENQSYLDNDKFIRKRPPKTDFMCCIDYKNRTYGFWLDARNGDVYVDTKYDPSSYNHYSLTKDDHSLNTFLIKNATNTQIKTLVWLFRAGCMYFEDVQIKAQCYEMLSFFVR